jgi:hypothetical protein
MKRLLSELVCVGINGRMGARCVGEGWLVGHELRGCASSCINSQASILLLRAGLLLRLEHNALMNLSPIFNFTHICPPLS